MSEYNILMAIILAMITSQWPLIILKGIDNLVLMAINFTLLYIFVCCFKIQWLVLPSISHIEAVMTTKILAGQSFRPPVI